MGNRLQDCLKSLIFILFFTCRCYNETYKWRQGGIVMAQPAKEGSKLKQLLDILKNQINNVSVYNYVVPDLWNAWNYDGDEVVRTSWGEIMVNPYNFYSRVIESYILPKAEEGVNYNQSLSQLHHSFVDKPGYLGGDWIKKATVYSMMVRTSTSWDHDRSGDLESQNIYGLKETGTFVKSLALLPLLKKMGVNTVYMLPISKFSLKDKKGELGSPYGVCNFFELDPSLKDPMTGSNMTVEEEFQAFVEACHILDMKVMIDIIPRTNSVESDLIVEHPDWFYWVYTDTFHEYYPPYVPGLGDTLTPKPEFLPYVYQSEQVWNHIRKFSYAPNIIDSEKWDRLVEEYKQTEGASILDLVKRDFGLTVAPAFSDHINDVQPPWTDVTFFRMYMDHPVESQKYLGGANPAPYILFDTIKSNLYKGNVINEGLWATLSNVIPFYQQQYGIDGARIDMGHALPSELVDRIISNARANDKDFCFIAEELQDENAWTSRNIGYNMIIGYGFYQEPRVREHRTHNFMYESRHLPCPVFAGGETHDTPRLAAREGGRTLSKMLTIMNMFMPNGVPFINSGQEVYETQPMNTGLDCRDNEQYMLPAGDRYFGKLALFDKFALHYLNHMRWNIPDTLDAISKIRNEHLETFTNVENFIGLGFDRLSDPAIGFGYIEDGKRGHFNNNLFIIVASTNMYSPIDVTVHIEDLRYQSGNNWLTGRLLYSTHEWGREVHEFDLNGNLRVHLQPGEVKIIKL